MKPKRSSTCWMAICERTSLRSIPGIDHPEARIALASGLMRTEKRPR